MPASFALTTRSTLQAPPEAVWLHATSLGGINAELGPWVRLAHGLDHARITEERATQSGPAVKVTLLFLGVLPFDRMGLNVDAWSPGTSFRENNRSILLRRWIFERSLERTDEGCEVVDRLVYEPRLPGVGYFVLPLVARMLERRHRTLRKMFDGDLSTRPRTTRTCGAGAEEEAAAVAVGVGLLATVFAVAVGVWLGSKRRA